MNRSEKFLKAHLEGERFEQHTIPLDLLRDLSAIEDLIVEAAKWQYLQDHPERVRVPKGFTDTVFLSLAAIESGSAVATINLVVKTEELFDQAELYFDRARESVLGAINAAEQSGPILEHLPDTLLNYFNRIGRGLRQREALVLGNTENIMRARLTPQVRKTLVFATDKTKQYSEDVTLRGYVPEADQEHRTFQLLLVGGRRIGADIDPAHESVVIRAFNHYREKMKISVQGVGVYDKANRLQRIETVDHVAELDPLDIAARIDELKLLTDGWLDGRGRALDSGGLDWIQELLETHLPDGLPLPYLYPTPEGGIQAEWSIGGTEVSLEFDLAQHIGEWHGYDPTTGAELVEVLNFNEPEAIGWVVQQLEKLQHET